MSYLIRPGIIHGDIDTAKPFLCGIDSDDGLFCFYSTGLLSYIVSAQLSYNIVVDGHTLVRQATTINDYAWFLGDGYQLYYTAAYGWVYISITRSAGYIPYEYQDTTLTTWYGDSFFAGVAIPTVSSQTDTTLTGRGTNKNSDPIPTVTASFSWPRWIKDSSPTSAYGNYTAAGGATGTQVIGLPSWIDGDNVLYTRSLDQKDGHYIYGRLYYDVTALAWVIGSYGSSGGWWQGSEPATSGTSTYAFTVPVGSEVTGDDIELTFNGYVCGANRTEQWLAEVGLCR